MSRVIWHEIGDKGFEAGVDRTVLYPQTSGSYPKGVAWNGVTTITESPEGGDSQDFYADNIKYGSLRGAENFGGTIECYTYPDEWKKCDGRTNLVPGVTLSQQSRGGFGLSYRTLLGSDSEELGTFYTIHLIYGATASPSSKTRSTINESPEAGTFSFEFKTTPVGVSVIENAKATSHIELDTSILDSELVTKIENVLYGTNDSYNAAVPEIGDNPKTKGWYEKLPDGTYVATTDETVDDDKTYYEKIAGVDGRLPLPDELYALLTE